jgi:hypothetical protein
MLRIVTWSRDEFVSANGTARARDLPLGEVARVFMGGTECFLTARGTYRAAWRLDHQS